MRTKLVIFATAAAVATGFVVAPGAAVAGTCAPGSTDGEAGTIPEILHVPVPVVGNAYVYSTVPGRPFGPRPRGAAGVNNEAFYVETFGAAPTKDGHLHGDVYGTPVNFDVAIGTRPGETTPATVTRLCVAGTQYIGDDYGYTPPAP